MATGKTHTAEAKRLQAIYRWLDKNYSAAETALTHQNPLQLLVATILSAQSTDVRVNMVTPKLFKRYPDAPAFARAKLPELEQLIYSTGFYRAKARAIKETCTQLVEKHDGQVPRTMDELTALRGVARKTANVVLGSAFAIADGVVVDTHVKRIAARLGLTKHKDPVKVERDLMAIVPRKRWIAFSHQLILHGRALCLARKPKCDQCALVPHCPSSEITSRKPDA